ncbi:AraC family transcriptional regulator [Flavobacteriaceae bacterium]|jgi:AraC family transcriptional activator of pyochelin receptor|nr:helix-turn-helix transcriptional regulator [Flavobacteriaceae bacterium]MDA9246617.1 AraC family transcriptional regulator [bacterium]MBT4314049.1 helix-turn-helix transcriptional regulator [Flavobacteriaceae bacterium]MBT5092148.1 helix-turn-helix transcriptional regulator [Flavobacteriaceae bacterium]MBT5283548.1 helix-turn-helix transcriptional regulator [Flavobacteriaceae bacterium]|tara:strand:- start:33160 stop:34047 length:888 start_codon:yes stop_codon:yes gene_type:complete
MEIKNDVKSTFQVSVLDSGFTVLRVKNDSQDAVIEKYPVNQDFIQFHFCLKGQMNFIFNEGNYSFPVNEDHSMLLFNPQKALPIQVELAPNSWLVSVLISISKFHSLFSADADHISFLTPENSSKKYYDNLPFTSSIAVVLSQILQAKVHDSMKSLYFKGKVYELLSLYFNKSEDPSLEQCPFLVDEENVRKIRKAKDIILERMSDPPSLENLATEIGLSLKKLKEGFKQLYGDTVFAYLLDHKMEEARRMLNSQKFNVNEVGLKLGYSTASHFIAAFKKKYGTTPKKYLGSLSS